jgi:hypothetical protein
MTLAVDARSAFRNLRRGGWLSVTVVLFAVGDRDLLFRSGA